MNSQVTRYALRYARRHPRTAVKTGLLLVRRRKLIFGGIAAGSAAQDPEVRAEVMTAATAGIAAARRIQELSRPEPPPKQHRLRGTVVTVALLGAAAAAGHRAGRRFDK